jgi:cardiolipin synthase
MRLSKLITIIAALTISTATRAYDIPFPYNRIANASAENPVLAPVDSNDVELITSGERFFGSLLEDIASAKTYINMECYKFLDDETGRMVRDAIVAKAR